MRKSHENPSDSKLYNKSHKLGASIATLAVAVGTLAGCGEKVSADNEPAPTETTQSTVEETKAPEKTYSQEDFKAYTEVDINGAYGAMKVAGSSEFANKVSIDDSTTLAEVARMYLDRKYVDGNNTFPSSEGMRYLCAVLSTVHPDNLTFQAAARSLNEEHTPQANAEDFNKYRQDLVLRAHSGDIEARNEIRMTVRQLLDFYQKLYIDTITGNAGHPGNMSTEDHESAENILHATGQWMTEDGGFDVIKSLLGDVNKEIDGKVRSEISPEDVEQAANFFSTVKITDLTEVSLPSRIINEADSILHTSYDTYFSGCSESWEMKLEPGSGSNIRLSDGNDQIVLNVQDGKIVSRTYYDRAVPFLG